MLFDTSVGRIVGTIALRHVVRALHSGNMDATMAMDDTADMEYDSEEPQLVRMRSHAQVAMQC